MGVLSVVLSGASTVIVRGSMTEPGSLTAARCPLSELTTTAEAV